MPKQKTSKKRGFCIDDIPVSKTSKKAKLKNYNPSEYFGNPGKVGRALLECLESNDADSFIDILDAYLMVDRTQVAKKAKLARSTVNDAMAGRKNPSLRTLAKIVHEAKKAA